MKKVILSLFLATFMIFPIFANEPIDIHEHTESVQCEGKTKSGNRCKRKVTNDTYCFQHISQKPKK